MKNSIYTIRNEYIKVDISSLGAEMQSIQNKSGDEYLWQGDEKYWADRAINLFPYVGRLNNKTYIFHGREYRMDIHGFAMSSEMAVDYQSEKEISFLLKDNQHTKEMYPFSFEYRVKYKLDDSSVVITYEVTNRDDNAMYFGLGGHPGFNVPLNKELDFTDYYLEFDNGQEPYRVGMSSSCFVNGCDKPFKLSEGSRLPLTHKLLDNDAIILLNMGSTVALKTNKDAKAVRVSYPQMKYLGLWHKPFSDAPYICIEPWASLPSREGIVEDIERQPGLIKLPSDEVYSNTWSIAVI